LLLEVEQALVGVVEQPVGPTAARISRGILEFILTSLSFFASLNS